jgi:universal stress protein A
MYNKVIIAVDFSESSQRVIDRALELVDNDHSKVVLAHVVEPIPKIWGMESYATNPDDLQDKILEKTKEMLNELGDKIGITERRVMLGGPASKIRELQAGYEADAIVIGSHGHSGWKLMLGSTAINLLHGATCDVLTVYVG